MPKSNEEILRLWNDQEACPDFEPVLLELLAERDQTRKTFNEFFAGFEERYTNNEDQWFLMKWCWYLGAKLGKI